MTEHAANGVYDGAAVTTWERGSSAAVIWKADGKHRGNQNARYHEKFELSLWAIKMSQQSHPFLSQVDMLTGCAS